MNTENFDEIDEELKEKYKLYCNVDPDDKTYKFFTENEQIERYSKNIAFWVKENINDKDFKQMTTKEINKMYFTSYSLRSILNIINEKFKSRINTRKKIFERALDIIINEKIDNKLYIHILNGYLENIYIEFKAIEDKKKCPYY